MQQCPCLALYAPGEIWEDIRVAAGLDHHHLFAFARRLFAVRPSLDTDHHARFEQGLVAGYKPGSLIDGRAGAVAGIVTQRQAILLVGRARGGKNDVQTSKAADCGTSRRPAGHEAEAGDNCHDR